MSTRASEYLSFILAILVVNTRHFVPLDRRIRITTVSMPSIFHAEAWRQYQGLAREYMNLSFLMEVMNTRNIMSRNDYLDYNYKGEV